MSDSAAGQSTSATGQRRDLATTHIAGARPSPTAAPTPAPRHDEHLGGAEPPPESRGVHRARSAEGDDPEPSRVLPLSHRVKARRARHLLDDDVVDRHRRILDRAPEGHRDLALDGLPGESRVEPEVALARIPAGPEVAEHEVRVGHRRPPPAPPVARRPRLAPRALRPDRHEPERVDGRDAAAPPPRSR